MKKQFGFFVIVVTLIFSVGCSDDSGSGGSRSSDSGCLETDPIVGTTCDTGFPGVCAEGFYVCYEGELICEANHQPGDLVEICDGLDNNCNGLIDDGIEGLGEICFAGEGICSRAGIKVCDPSDPYAPPICGAEPDLDMAQEEVCDGMDRNCDGIVDTGFTDEDGRYIMATHCGNCYTDCTSIYDRPNAYGICSYYGNGKPFCEMQCDSGYFDLNMIPDDGCEFYLDGGAIYVSSLGEDIASCGLGPAGTVDEDNEPCRTITYGISRAVETGHSRVMVSDGFYRENIIMQPGIDLLGGYNKINWIHDPEINISIISGISSGKDNASVTAESIAVSTTLSGFTIIAPSGGDGGNSTGIYVIDSNNSLIIADNRVLGGRGGNGSPGEFGLPGVSGENGDNGRNASVESDCSVSSFPGGAPGFGGGAGGVTNCPEEGNQNGSGASGVGGAQGGSGGWHMTGSGGNCFPGTGTFYPASGFSGQKGSDGSGGSGAVNNQGLVDMILSQWRGAAGGHGNGGTHGNGGGGGGAAAGVYTITDRWFGASGGGGGGGGTGGTGGNGGSPGGGSFGIFIYWTKGGPVSGSYMPVITGNTIIRGQGGSGGIGGYGGPGGDGGSGASGGGNFLSESDGSYYYCMVNGGDGGNGGRGGHGGGGGGGQGGVSYDIYAAGVNGSNPLDYENNNLFELDDDIITGGSGGAGGYSINPVFNGTQGSGGHFGRVRFDN